MTHHPRRTRPRRLSRGVAALASTVLATGLAACGAGSEVGGSAPDIACDIDQPKQATTVNILAYNSTATDPFTEAVTANCKSKTLTLNHPATDLVGQKQRAVQSLSRGTASYDLIEQFGTVYPLYADRGWTIPLDEYAKEGRERYDLAGIDPKLLAAHEYDGKLYGLPTYWSVNHLVYRKDVFDDLGIEPPKTLADVRDAAKKIQDAGDIKYPLAVPMAPANDAQGLFGQALRSLGGDYFDGTSPTPTIDSPNGEKAITAIRSLLPYMSPQALSFSSPEVTTQLQTGQAAMGMLVTGRLAPLVDKASSPYADEFGFATPPSVEAGGDPMSFLSVDGFAVAKNSKVDPTLLFELAAVATGKEASTSAMPDALPARLDLIDDEKIPFAASAKTVLGTGPRPLNQVPYMADVYSVIGAPLGDGIAGKVSPAESVQEAQKAAENAIRTAGYDQ